MACYECEHKRPPDEYTSNETEPRHLGTTRTWPERGTPTRVPEVSDAWNFDFDDNESDGADVAAFEFADSSKRGLEEGNFKGSRGRRSNLGDRKPTPYPSRTGFDDFDDEDDDLDSYEIDSSKGGTDSEVARRSFSELEESDLEDYDGFDRSKKISGHRSRNFVTPSDNDDDDDDDDVPYFRGKQGNPKSNSDSDHDDGFRSYKPKRSQRVSCSDFESDGDDYLSSTKNNFKGAKFVSRGHSGRAKETNQSRRHSKVHDQEDSWGQIRRKGDRFGNDAGFRGSQRKEMRNSDRSKVHDQEDSWGQIRRKGDRFGNDAGFRGSQRKEMRNSDRFDRRYDVPSNANENARFNSRHRR